MKKQYNITKQSTGRWKNKCVRCGGFVPTTQDYCVPCLNKLNGKTVKENLPDILGPTQMEVYKFLTTKQNVSREDIEKALKLGQNSLSNPLRKLIKNGHVKRYKVKKWTRAIWLFGIKIK